MKWVEVVGWILVGGVAAIGVTIAVMRHHLQNHLSRLEGAAEEIRMAKAQAQKCLLAIRRLE